MWIAKSKYNGKTYGKLYYSIYDCQAYIDKNLKKLSDKHRKLRALAIFKERYNRVPLNDIDIHNYKQYMNDQFKLFVIELNLCNGIICYNVEQERFCEGFDF